MKERYLNIMNNHEQAVQWKMDEENKVWRLILKGKFMTSFPDSLISESEIEERTMPKPIIVTYKS